MAKDFKVKNIYGKEPKISVMVDLKNYMTAGENGKVKLPKQIQVLPMGMWDTEQYGPMTITRAYLEAIVDNYKKNLRKGLPIDKDHNRQEATGWMENPVIKEDGENPGLYCDTEWTPLGESLLGGKIYRFFSPEWTDNYTDPETGIQHGPALIAGTLTNRPLFKELVPLVASEGNLTTPGSAVVLLSQQNFNTPSTKPMSKLETVLAKKASELTAEEKALIVAHEKDLNDEQKKTFSEVLEANKVAEEKAKAEADAKAKAEKEAKEKAEAEAKKGNEQLVTMTAAEKEQLVKNAEAGKQAMEILENKKAEETAQGFLMSEDGKKGKILAKGKDTLTKLIRSFSDTQMKYFSEVMDAIPETKLFSEIGSGANGNGDGTSKTAFEAKVAEIKKASEGKLTERQAMLEVAEKYPDLYKAYEADLQPTKRSSK